MDGRCPHATVRLTKALFGKRAVKLGFSAGSALESLRVGATSGAAAAAETAGALPNAVALGLERSRKIVDAGRPPCAPPALDQRLSVLTRELQLKRQEIAQAGLLATAARTPSCRRSSARSRCSSSARRCSPSKPTSASAPPATRRPRPPARRPTARRPTWPPSPDRRVDTPA